VTHRHPATVKKLAWVTVVVACALGAAASSGSAGSGPSGNVPNHAAQGQVVGVAVAVRPAGVRCGLSVRYADGALQAGLKSAVAKAGRAAWEWRVSETAATGAARVVVSCGKGGRLERTMRVVAKPKTAPKVVVANQGYSLRYLSRGATASFGVVLKNTSPDEDALDVRVLVNFLDPANVVVGSVSQKVDAVAANTTYNYGGSLNWNGQPTLSRLEIVVTVGAHQPAKQKYPELANVRIVPSPFDPGFVGEVDGELLNGDNVFTLANARLSAVILDAAGNVIGGGSGSSAAPVPPNARILFKATGGFKAIKIDQAASALVSITPNWRRET
jgi:hypothetical protein